MIIYMTLNVAVTEKMTVSTLTLIALYVYCVVTMVMTNNKSIC